MIHISQPAVAAPSDSLIPLERLIGPAKLSAPRISPDGKWISFIAPREGAANLWIAPATNPAKSHAITQETGRGIQTFDVSGRVTYRWTSDSRRIVFFKDRDGDENWQVNVVDVASGATRALTAIQAAQVRLYGLGEKNPDVALVGINLRNAARHDVYRLNLATGDTTLVERNERFVAIIADREPRPRLGIVVTPTASLELWNAKNPGRWEKIDEIPAGESFGKVLGFDPASRTVYATSARERNTLGVVERDLVSGSVKRLAEDPRADIADVLAHPVSGKPQAYASHWTRREWKVIDPSVAKDLEYLRSAQKGDAAVESRSLDDQRWIVTYTFDNAPPRTFLYERSPRRLVSIGTSRPELEGLTLASTHPIVTQSRDSLTLVSYVTLPRGSDPDGDGVPSKPLPMVLVVHGGPGDERAEWAFSPFIQWLANRGYAVLNANFRGSPGFGKAFQDAERLEWGGKMNDDLEDQVKWTIAKRIADPARVAILGGSYGGYATLVGMTKTPDLFACAVDVVGPANLETFMATIPPHWSLDHFARRVGDPRTPEGRAHLRARSPYHNVGQVKHPILIAQGANDVRVPQAESDSMVAALARRQIPVTYLVFPDEGHGFIRKENSRAFHAVTEAFLAKWVGGRSAPIGASLEGSSVQVPEGAKHVPGLSEALASRPIPVESAGVQGAAVVGRYEIQGMVLTVMQEGERLLLEQPGEPRVELKPVAGGDYEVGTTGLRVRFDASIGTVTTMKILAPGRPTMEARRLP